MVRRRLKLGPKVKRKLRFKFKLDLMLRLRLRLRLGLRLGLRLRVGCAAWRRSVARLRARVLGFGVGPGLE